MTKLQLADLPMVETNDYSGYIWDDLQECLNEDELKSLSRFMRGQTGAIHHGKMLVYKWDVERWLDGLPVID